MRQCFLSGHVPGTLLSTLFIRPSQQLREVVAVKNVLAIQMGKPRPREVIFPRLSWAVGLHSQCFSHPGASDLVWGGMGGGRGEGDTNLPP